MSALGQKRTFCGAIAMSALPPKADIPRCMERPLTLRQKRKFRTYSITTSAMVRRVGGISSSSALSAGERPSVAE